MNCRYTKEISIFPAIGYSIGINRTGLQARARLAHLEEKPDSDLH